MEVLNSYSEILKYFFLFSRVYTNILSQVKKNKPCSLVAYFWNAILMHFQFLCEFEILGKLILQNYCSAITHYALKFEQTAPLQEMHCSPANCLIKVFSPKIL